MPAAGVLGRVTAVLCLSEIISWGVLYYSLPTLAPSISFDTGWSTTFVSASLSAALLGQAAGSFRVGRLLDAHGPRAVMTGGSLLGSLAMVAVALAPGRWVFIAGWVVAGFAMAATLYAPAFAALTRWWGRRRVTGLTILTLVAGFASTIFAPICVALSDAWGWRTAYLILAGILAVATIPLHLFGLAVPWPAADEAVSASTDDAQQQVRRIMGSGAYLVVVASFVLAAFAIYAAVFAIVPLMLERGATQATGAWALGLIGAGQVLGRLGYARLSRTSGLRGRTAAIFTACGISIAGLALIPGPAWLLLLVALLMGMFRGLFTLLQATAMADRYPAAYYGRLSGGLSAGLSVAQAAAPIVGAALAMWLGGYPAAYLIFAVVGLAAACCAAVPSAGRVAAT